MTLISYRKYKTIQQDKMRGFNTSYMANYTGVLPQPEES